MKRRFEMSTQYKNKGGDHTTGDGAVVPTGGVFIDDDDELCSKFPGKFEVVGIAHTTANPAGEPNEHDGEGTDEGEGEDVTGDFELAKENDFKVIKTEKGWNVFNNDGDLINGNPLRKKEVIGVINEWLEA